MSLDRWPDPAVTGIVLAGGRSSRFGRDKLAEPYLGRPLLHHAVLRLGEVCDQVVVVLGPAHPEPTLPTGVKVRFARDAAEGEGPLVGLVAGLSEAGTELALIVGGDMPEISPAVLRQLVRRAEEISADAVALADGTGVRPLPCLLRVHRASELAPSLLGAGTRRLRDLLEAMRVVPVDEATWLELDPGRRTLFDVDEPQDLS